MNAPFYSPYSVITIRALAALFAATAPLAAQPNPAPPIAATPDSVRLEAVLAARERRANLLRDEIKELDSRIETGGDALIGSLSSLGDSKDSRTEVARMKEETIEAIRRNMRYYRMKRSAIREELRRPTINLTAEQKREIIAGFDERIEKRIGQILQLLKSMPTHKDYEQYTVEGSSWLGPAYKLNEDYLQNQQLASITARLRREVEAGLRKSIARLEQHNRELRAQSNTAPYADYPNDLNGQLGANDSLIAERHKQIDALISFNPTPTRPIGQKEAIDFDHARSATVAELQRDFSTLFQRYNTLIPELCAINTTRTALAALRAQTRGGTPSSGH